MKQYKRRYAIVKFYDSIEKDEIMKLIENTFKSLFGMIDYSFSNIKLIFFDIDKKIAIFRFNNNYIEEFRTTIFLLRDSGNKQARITFVSGTLKKIKGILYIEEKVKS